MIVNSYAFKVPGSRALIAESIKAATGKNRKLYLQKEVELQQLHLSTVPPLDVQERAYRTIAALEAELRSL